MTGTGPLVAVLGEALLRADPEVAVLSASLGTEGPDRPQVLSRIGDVHKHTWHTLVAIGNDLNVETGSVAVHPRYVEPGPLRRPPSFIASVDLRVEVTDFSLLPDVLAVLGAVDGGSFSGPSWQLRPDSDVYRRARRAAIHDALRRAEEYATALGCTLTEMVDLTDTVDGHGVVPFAADQALSMDVAGSGRGAGGLANLDLRPLPQQARGAVRARFRMTVPDLDALLEHPPPG